MPIRASKLLEVAQEALEKLSDTYRSPRMLEADLDILASALRKLPHSLTKLPKQADRAYGLCDVLYNYFKAGLLSSDAVESCERLEELAEESDYDISDKQKFEERVSEKLAILKEAVEKMLTSFEDEADTANN